MNNELPAIWPFRTLVFHILGITDLAFSREIQIILNVPKTKEQMFS